MIKAIDVVNKAKEDGKMELIKEFKKCTVCGLYGKKEELITDVDIHGNVYVYVCNNCNTYLEEGGKIKKRKYFTEQVEEFL